MILYYTVHAEYGGRKLITTKRKGRLIVLTAMAVVAALSGGFFYFHEKQLPEFAPGIENVESPMITIQGIPEPIVRNEEKK